MKSSTKFNDRTTSEMGKGFKGIFGVDANVRVEVFNEKGELKEERIVHNTVTAPGLAGIMSQISDDVTKLTVATYLELGTATAWDSTNKKLGAAIKAANGSPQVDTRQVVDSYSRSAAVVTYEHTWAAGEISDSTAVGVQEAGLFPTSVVDEGEDGGAGKDIWLYVTFASVGITSADTLKITWTLTAS